MYQPVQESLQCLHAFAMLNHNPGKELLVAVQQHVVSHRQLNAQSAANCIWALALMHALLPDTWSALIRAFAGMLGPDQNLSGEWMQQLQLKQLLAISI